MSCHSIGHGINAVMEVVLDLYEEGEITPNAVRRLGHIARQAVNWCDGNAGEAVEVFLGHMCGRCLKVVEDMDELYSIFGSSLDWEDNHHIISEEENPLASYEFCADCFDFLVNQATGDPNAGFRDRQDIDECRRRM